MQLLLFMQIFFLSIIGARFLEEIFLKSTKCLSTGFFSLNQKQTNCEVQTGMKIFKFNLMKWNRTDKFIFFDSEFVRVAAKK